jgi:uncharacterized protein (DUF983 family)
MNSDKPETEGQPAAAQAALFGLCPKCGAKSLFKGATEFAPSCSVCGLDYSRFNVGDGPAAFLTMGIGLIVVLLAVKVEFSLHPPWWVHVLLWVPFTGGAVLWGLRVTKAWLLQAEYWRKAREATGSDLGANDLGRGE